MLPPADAEAELQATDADEAETADTEGADRIADQESGGKVGDVHCYPMGKRASTSELPLARLELARDLTLQPCGTAGSWLGAITQQPCLGISRMCQRRAVYTRAQECNCLGQLSRVLRSCA